MLRFLLIALTVSFLTITSHSGASAEGSAESPLEDVWNARSMESDGEPAPADAVRRMRFTFKGSKLFVRGNFDDDREEECTFTIDPAQTPKHLHFTPPGQETPVLAIYELKGDELRICLRHGMSSKGRPTEFTTKPASVMR